MADTRILTLTDKKKLEEQLAQLNEEKKRVAEEIQIARGFGDLSENAEYDAAKAKEAEVYGNIARIEAELREKLRAELMAEQNQAPAESPVEESVKTDD